MYVDAGSSSLAELAGESIGVRCCYILLTKLACDVNLPMLQLGFIMQTSLGLACIMQGSYKPGLSLIQVCGGVGKSVLALELN